MVYLDSNNLRGHLCQPERKSSPAMTYLNDNIFLVYVSSLDYLRDYSRVLQEVLSKMLFRATRLIFMHEYTPAFLLPFSAPLSSSSGLHSLFLLYHMQYHGLQKSL